MSTLGAGQVEGPHRRAGGRKVLEPLWLGQRRRLERPGRGSRAGPSSRLEEPVYLLPGVGEEPADWSVSNPVI